MAKEFLTEEAGVTLENIDEMMSIAEEEETVCE